MGNVVNGKFPFSLNHWYWLPERQKVLDFVLIDWGFNILAVSGIMKSNFDPMLFLKPFQSSTWIMIAMTILAQFILFKLGSKVKKMDKKKMGCSKKLVELTIYFFFVLIHAYYGGALVMFFATEPEIPFNSLEDVLQNVPPWRLQYPRFEEILFKQNALRNVPVYVKFWAQVEQDRAKYSVENVAQGLEKLHENQVALYGNKGQIIRAYNDNPEKYPPLKLFGGQKYLYYMCLTKNSPLTPYFKKITGKTIESGLRNVIIKHWIGPDVNGVQQSQQAELTIGQTFLAFGVLFGSAGLAFLAFIFETIFAKSQKLCKDTLSIPK